MEDLLEPHLIPEVSAAYCAQPGLVRLFLTSKDEALLKRVASEARELFRANVLPAGVTSLPEDVLRLLEAKKLMWEKCGIVRSVAGLNEGLEELRKFNSEVETEMKKKTPKTVALLEFRNAVESSILIVKSALARKESRGLQSILDYPNLSPKIVHHSIFLKYPLEEN